MIQNHFDEEKKSFTKTLEKLVSLYTTYLVEESLCSRFWEDSGREKLPYSLREIEDDGRVPPRKKRGWPPKALAIVQEFHESTKETDCHIMMIVIV